MKMKMCELCVAQPARICCESDQASLCWGCDEKVHAANFLVAKHSRCLLCHVCHSPTPWTASGPKFSPTVSVCNTCLHNYGKRTLDQDQDREEVEEEDDCDDYSQIGSDEEDLEEDEDEDDEEDEEEEEEEGENQVVPWSCTASLPPPPAASSSCSDGDSLTSAVRGGASKLKRVRQNASLDSDDEIGCCSSQMGSGNEEGSSVGLMRPLKQPRTSELLNQLQKLEEDGETESRSAAAVCTVGRLQRRVVNGDDEATSFVLGLCKLSRDRGR